MKDYFIRNTSGDLLKIINTDFEKLEKVNEMYEALKSCKSFLNHHSDNLTDFEIEFEENLEGLLKQLEK
jgi:hypothetical protein